nr:putative reverse transcriptase domain-containing protein [Tanacetum cinerariifolium]
MQAARDRQKSYAAVRHKPLELAVGDKVMLKDLPWKGVIHFGKRGKLNPRYVGIQGEALSSLVNVKINSEANTLTFSQKPHHRMPPTGFRNEIL